MRLPADRQRHRQVLGAPHEQDRQLAGALGKLLADRVLVEAGAEVLGQGAKASAAPGELLTRYSSSRHALGHEPVVVVDQALELGVDAGAAGVGDAPADRLPRLLAELEQAGGADQDQRLDELGMAAGDPRHVVAAHRSADQVHRRRGRERAHEIGDEGGEAGHAVGKLRPLVAKPWPGLSMA